MQKLITFKPRKMKNLTIELPKDYEDRINHILTAISNNINQGFKSGLDFPVNWKIENADKHDLNRFPEQKRMLIKQVLEIFDRNDMFNQIINLTSKAYDSGAIETENLKQEDFSQAKIILSAILNQLQWQTRPNNPEGLREVENLKNII